VRVAIAGLGLIGGSLARALTARGHRVIGVDRAPALRRARAARAVSGTAPSVEAAAPEADVLVLAAPPRDNLALLRRVARACRDGLVVTDVGSVKGPIAREARRLGLARFVGGHPVAGSEGSGFSASSATLFLGHSWVLTPPGEPAALRRVRALVRAAGARPVFMDADEHDRALAFLSHVPQVVSWALLEAARGDAVARRSLSLAGPGFRDMTRLAKSPRPLWREILGENRVEVARALRALQRALPRSAGRRRR
jgi:prephenate dehydrogenase